MAWFYLLLAGICEVVWAVASKYIDGFNKVAPLIVVAIGYICSMTFLIKALKVIPLGVAYAIWMSIGIIGTNIIGMIFLKESFSVFKLICISSILFGVIGLKSSN